MRRELPEARVSESLKSYSNGKSSCDLLVIVDTKTDAKELKDDVLQLVLRRLPRHHPAVYDHCYEEERTYRYHVVCGTSNWSDAWSCVAVQRSSPRNCLFGGPRLENICRLGQLICTTQTQPAT
jgi:hypothetical protein